MRNFCSSTLSHCALLFLATCVAAASDEKGRDTHAEPCGENAVTDEDGKCVCQQGLVEDADGDCCHENLIDLYKGESQCFIDPDWSQVAVAYTLMGSFGFVVSLQFFTKADSLKMRAYAYKVLCSTVSIFTAVMMFQCIDGLVDYYINKRLPNRFAQFGVDVTHMAFWFIVTQLMLGFASSALMQGKERTRISAQALSSNHLEVAEFIDLRAKVDGECRSWGTLCAHLTGFASINAFTDLQQSEPFNQNPLMALVPMLFALITLQAFERMTDRVREKLIARDRIRDFFENKWDEQCEEAEDDVLGLTLSVLAVNALRMAINGMTPLGEKCLPDQVQREVGEACTLWLQEEGRTNLQVALLFLVGLICCGSLFFVRLIQDLFFPLPKDDEADEQAPVSQKYDIVDRIAEGLVVAFSMAFSWCMFHANRQLLMKLNPSFFGNEENATTLALVLALEATYIGFMLIRILNMIEDLPDRYTPPAVDDSIESVSDALALLIGFAWQQLFQDSLDDVAGKFRKNMGPAGPVLAKFVLGSLISAFIFATYRRFTIPFIVKKGWEHGRLLSAHELPAMIKKLAAKGDHLAKAYHEELMADGIAPEDQVFRALREDDKGALAQKNQKLLLRIKEAEEETKRLQQNLESFSGEMLASLEGICQIVTDIERE